jgi:hypothetical protein
MKSILDLLAMIAAIPFIDNATAERARFLRSKLGGDGFLGSIFGGL